MEGGKAKEREERTSGRRRERESEKKSIFKPI
jgi:hypothetical protein